MLVNRTSRHAGQIAHSDDDKLAQALGHARRIGILRILCGDLEGSPLTFLAASLSTDADVLAPHLARLMELGTVETRRTRAGDVVYAMSATPLARELVQMFAPAPVVADQDDTPLTQLELDTVLDQVATGVAIYDADGHLIRMNPAAERITRRRALATEPAENRQTRYAMRHPDGTIMREQESPSGRARRGETFVNVPFVIDGEHGPETYILTSGTPLVDAAGKAHGAVVVFHNVTEQRLLKLEEARQRVLADTIIEWAPVGIGLYDTTDEFRCVRHNAAFLQLVGPEFRAQGSIDGVPLDDLFDEDSRARVRAIYERVRASGEPFTIDEFPAVLMPDPEPRWYRWSLLPLTNEQGHIYALMNCATEITELVRARNQLREQAARLRAVIAAMPEAVALADREGNFVLTNAAAEALWGQTPPDRVATEDYATVFVCYAPDGTRLPSDELPLPRALAGETVIGQELTYVQPGGKRLDLLCNAAPVYEDGTRNLLGGVVVFQDITRIKALERQRDEFLSIAAHELRTPLTSIIGTLQVLLRQLARVSEKPLDTTALHRGLDRVNRQAARIDNLVGDLLDTSHIASGHLQFTLERCDLAPIMREAVEGQRVAHPNRDIVMTEPEHSITVIGDTSRLGQVVDNLLSNALKYSGSETPVQVALDAVDGLARLRVTDFGIGLPPESVERVFERFYRAPGVEVRSGSGVGLGLGLYITRTIVERHRGTVSAASQVGAGTTFTVLLPLAPPPGEQV